MTWGWDLDHLSYSRKGPGFLGISNQANRQLKNLRIKSLSATLYLCLFYMDARGYDKLCQHSIT